MRIIGCDLHARQQTLAMLDTTTGEVEEVTLKHQGDNVREFYAVNPNQKLFLANQATGKPRSQTWVISGRCS